MDTMPLQDPTSVMGFYTNIEKTALFDYLKYLPAMDDFAAQHIVYQISHQQMIIRFHVCGSKTHKIRIQTE